MYTYKVMIFCGLLSCTLGNPRTEFESSLHSPWHIPLLAIGLVFGFAIVLVYMVRTNTTQVSDNASQGLNANASSKISARGDYRSTHSASVTYERPLTFTEKCCGVLCCKRPKATRSLKSIPSLDIPVDQYELVVEKLMLYDVPLAVTAVYEDLIDRGESTATMRKETESMLTPLPSSKKKSYNTLASYFAMIPGQPTKPDQESAGPAQQPDVQSATMTTSTYYDLVPRAQSGPVEDAGMNPVHSEVLSYYTTTPSGPLHNTPDDIQSTSTYFDMVPNVMSSQQSMPADNYGVSPSQPEGLRDESYSVPVQPVILPCNTTYTSPMKEEPTYDAGVPSLEQGKDYRIRPGPQYMCYHANRPKLIEEKVPLCQEPARFMPEVQSASYYDMIPQTLPPMQSLEEGEHIGLKPAQPVVQSYFASIEQQKPLDKHTEELGNVGEIRTKSRPSVKIEPFVSDSGTKQTMPPKESSLYYAMVPTSYRVKDTSSKTTTKSTKTKRDVQPVSTYFMKTYDSAPNVRSQSSRQHLVRNDIPLDSNELNDTVPKSLSSTDNTMPLYYTMVPQPESKYRTTESTFVPHQGTIPRSDYTTQPWQTVRRNDEVTKPSMGSNDTDVEVTEPQSSPAFVFGATERKTAMHNTISRRLPVQRETPMTGSSQLPTQGAIPMSDYTPVVALAQPWRATRINDNVEIIASGTRDTEFKTPEAKPRTIFGAKDTTTIMHASSSSKMHPSEHEPEVVTMSSGHLVPTTDEERRQMNQFLNQYSSIFTYNLKDPIPKDPERLPGRSSTPAIHHRESRAALAESLSHIGATEHSQSGFVNWNNTPRGSTPSNKREQQSDYQTQSSSKRPRTAEVVHYTADQTGRIAGNTHANIYTAQVYADNQQQDKNIIKDYDADEGRKTIDSVKPLQIPYDRISSEVRYTSFAGVPSTGTLNILSRQESGMSKEVGCAMLDFGSSQQSTVPVRESGVSKEIGCANLESYASQPHTVPIQESGVSKEMGCANLDVNLSKPDNVPIKASGMSKEIGCANLDDYPSTSAENTRSDRKITTAPVISSEMRCISTGQMHPRKMIITNKSGKSNELGCQQLEVASSHDESQPGEEQLCSPSASEKVEHLHEYDVDSTWDKKPTSVHSVHVSTHRGSGTTVASSSSAPIPATSSTKHPEESNVSDDEPCMHDSLKSIMAPTELGASSSVIDTRQLVSVKSSKKSDFNAKESTKGNTFTVAYAGTVNPVSFTNATSLSVVDANKAPATENNNEQVRKSNVSFKMPAIETDSQGSTWDDYEGEGARDLSIIDRPSSVSSQPPKGATLRWKIIIKHKPDDLESRARLPMLEQAAPTEQSPIDGANINNESDEEHTD